MRMSITRKTKRGMCLRTIWPQMEDRLRLLDTLPLCDWWVLELREEEELRQTLSIIAEYLRWRSSEKKPVRTSHQRRK